MLNDLIADFVGKDVLVRSDEAGVFVGRLESFSDQPFGLRLEGDVVRIWSWNNATSLSQLAETGPARSSGCKFCRARVEIIFNPCEILLVTQEAREAIDAVPQWLIQ